LAAAASSFFDAIKAIGVDFFFANVLHGIVRFDGPIPSVNGKFLGLVAFVPETNDASIA